MSPPCVHNVPTTVGTFFPQAPFLATFLNSIDLNPTSTPLVENFLQQVATSPKYKALSALPKQRERGGVRLATQICNLTKMGLSNRNKETALLQ